MHGKVLVLDPIATNRIALRVKFAACHYEVIQADSIAEAMRAIRAGVPDLILCSTKMPDGGPLRLMAKLKASKAAGKVPVIALCSAMVQSERMRLLAAGFEDVLQKPLDDALLIARARSVIRAYASAREWELRDDTSRALGFAEQSVQFRTQQSVRLISDNPVQSDRWHSELCTRSTASVFASAPADAVGLQNDGNAPDAFVLLIEPGHGTEMINLLATIRSHAKTRHSAILVVQTTADTALAAQMLDMGANDVMCSNPDPAELSLRLDALLARKRLGDALRDTVRSGVEAAISDPLTGLHNRRYAMPHLKRIAEHAASNRKPFAVMLADMDHFKRVNDLHGHRAGDAVLVETAQRLRENLRAVDLLARIGGEEFLIVLPGVDLANARNAAARLCDMVRERPFVIPDQDTQISVTISIGLTVCDGSTVKARARPLSAEELLARADQALYGAKAEGRNRVALHRPAA